MNHDNNNKTGNSAYADFAQLAVIFTVIDAG
jgi:hypothetical protein